MLYYGELVCTSSMVLKWRWVRWLLSTAYSGSRRKRNLRGVEEGDKVNVSYSQ